jgi:hypothetical protein
LEVKCEEDLVAKSHNDGGQAGGGSGDFTLDLFRKIVLPKLHQEVNEGEHFVAFRRVYNAIILAAFLKRRMEQTQSNTLRQLVDSNKPKSVLFTIENVAPLAGTSEQAGVLGRSETKAKVVEHLQSDAPAFDIPENVEFFEQYIRLFKHGLFRCARSETGDSQDERIIRVYFSGAIDFQPLKDVIQGQGTHNAPRT